MKKAAEFLVDKRRLFLCVFLVLAAVSVLLIAAGAIWLCFLSYRFLLIFLAIVLIAAGLLLKNNCR